MGEEFPELSRGLLCLIIWVLIMAVPFIAARTYLGKLICKMEIIKVYDS